MRRKRETKGESPLAKPSIFSLARCARLSQRPEREAVTFVAECWMRPGRSWGRGAARPVSASRCSPRGLHSAGGRLPAGARAAARLQTRRCLRRWSRARAQRRGRSAPPSGRRRPSMPSYAVHSHSESARPFIHACMYVWLTTGGRQREGPHGVWDLENVDGSPCRRDTENGPSAPRQPAGAAASDDSPPRRAVREAWLGRIRLWSCLRGAALCGPRSGSVV